MQHFDIICVRNWQWLYPAPDGTKRATRLEIYCFGTRTLLVGVCLAQPSDAFIFFLCISAVQFIHYCVQHPTPIASTDENHYIFHFSKTSW